MPEIIVEAKYGQHHRSDIVLQSSWSASGKSISQLGLAQINTTIEMTPREALMTCTKARRHLPDVGQRTSASGESFIKAM